jgi:hypothetical protein
VINEYQNISVVFREAWGRFDGKVMYFCSVVSLIFLLLTLLGYDIGPLRNQSGKLWPFWLCMPLIQFLLYTRLRQLDLVGDGKLGQVINAFHLILAQFLPIFFL